jgi:hypothetical protein
MGHSVDPPIEKSGKKLTPWWIAYMTILVLALLWFFWLYWSN